MLSHEAADDRLWMGISSERPGLPEYRAQVADILSNPTTGSCGERAVRVRSGAPTEAWCWTSYPARASRRVRWEAECAGRVSRRASGPKTPSGACPHPNYEISSSSAPFALGTKSSSIASDRMAISFDHDGGRCICAFLPGAWVDDRQNPFCRDHAISLRSDGLTRPGAQKRFEAPTSIAAWRRCPLTDTQVSVSGHRRSVCR